MHLSYTTHDAQLRSYIYFKYGFCFPPPHWRYVINSLNVSTFIHCVVVTCCYRSMCVILRVNNILLWVMFVLPVCRKSVNGYLWWGRRLCALIQLPPLKTHFVVPFGAASILAIPPRILAAIVPCEFPEWTRNLQPIPFMFYRPEKRNKLFSILPMVAGLLCDRWEMISELLHIAYGRARNVFVSRGSVHITDVAMGRLPACLPVHA